MDKVKVAKIVNIFCNNLNISNPLYMGVILELMENIILKYESCGIDIIYDPQEYLIKHSNCEYTVEEFFLNRLLFNVTNFEIRESGGRAEYTDYQKKIGLNRVKLNSLLDRYASLNFTDKQKFLAAKKVVMHEFEHALQTTFEKGPYINDVEHYKTLYTQLLNSNINLDLNEIYDGRKLLAYMGTGRRITSGLQGSNDFDPYKKYAGTFFLKKENVKYTSENNINEIFNESEALLISGSNEHVFESFPSGNRIDVRNIESSNSVITNYGFMLKILLGKIKTFEGMYLDRDVIIKYFNENYGQIFEDVFLDHLSQRYPSIKPIDGWSILHMAIGEAKYSYEDGALSYSDACHIKLNQAFSLCFEKFMKQKLDYGETFENLKEQWNAFAGLSLYNTDKVKHSALPHAKILMDLQQSIKQQSGLGVRK